MGFVLPPGVKEVVVINCLRYVQENVNIIKWYPSFGGEWLVIIPETKMQNSYRKCQNYVYVKIVWDY